MSKARLILTALIVDRQTPEEWAARYGVHRAWVYRLKARYETARGLITPEPRKRPRASYIRFQAVQPNQTWQADFTRYRLVDRTDVEILSWLDDHSRYALHLTCWTRVSGPIVGDTFRAAIAAHGIPASTLTDNGMVVTTRLASGRGGRNALEHQLRRLHVAQKNSPPNHPTTCGKVERFGRP